MTQSRQNGTVNVLAPTRYLWTFNSPRFSRHAIERRDFVPLNKVSQQIDGFTIYWSNPLKRHDLIHAFNRVPISLTPYIIGFESHLPRAFGREDKPLFRRMSESLAGDRCRKIIAISETAKRHFLKQHQDSPHLDVLTEKLVVRYPSMPIPDMKFNVPYEAGHLIRLLFVGNHYLRKGGHVGVKIAQLAKARGVPVQVDIISGMEIGSASWVDPVDPDYLNSVRQELETTDGVVFHQRQPSHRVLELMSQAHFSILPTFSDSFGFSVIESMVNGTPVVLTNQGVFPEFITDGTNGIMINLEVSSLNEWIHMWKHDRASKSFARLFDETSDDLAHQALDRIERLMSDPEAYQAMRRAARSTAERLFCAEKATAFWDSLYEEVL